MQLQSLSRRYTVRRLMETDVDAMLALCSGNPQFYRYHPPMATKASILDDLQAVPPGKTLSDKYFIGFYDGETLAGQRKTVFLPEGFALGVALVDGKAQCFELFGPQCLLAICNQCAAGAPALLGSIHHK